MSNSTEVQNLAGWFADLQKLRIACAKTNTSAKKMDLLTFANSKITTVLPSANEQGQFIIDAKTALSIDIAPDDLSTNFSTFEALLDNFSPLPTFVAVLLKTLAAGSFPQGSMADFLSAKIGAAFPGGGAGTVWSNAAKMVASAIPAVCFSSTLQVALAKTVDDGSQQVSNLVNQVAVLG